MQVDAHYLQLYLWRFVSDENLVIFLLDEIMTSSVHRCTDPIPMEASVVEVICDRGYISKQIVYNECDNEDITEIVNKSIIMQYNLSFLRELLLQKDCGIKCFIIR